MDIISELIRIFVFEKMYTTDLYSKVNVSFHIMTEYLEWISFYSQFKIIVINKIPYSL